MPSFARFGGRWSPGAATPGKAQGGRIMQFRSRPGTANLTVTTFTDALVQDWGELALVAGRIDSIEIDLINTEDASSHADLNGRRLSYLETLHHLAQQSVKIVEVFPGVTGQAAFEALLDSLEDAPARVVVIEGAPDLVNGGTNDYYWSDRQIADFRTLYQRVIFSGHIDKWGYTLNRFTLGLSGTERGEERMIPLRVVTHGAWPNSRFDQEGKAYPEVWGSPGTPLDSDKIFDGAGAVPAVLVDRVALKYVVAGHALTSMGGATAGTIAVWAKVPGVETFLGYIEGCTFSLSDTDGEGNACSTVTLPAFPKILCFIPGLTTGEYFTSTAGDPANACGRDASDGSLVENGEILDVAFGESIDQGTEVFRVWISIGGPHADLRARWCGPQATVVDSPGNTVGIDNASGWSASGNVLLSTGTFTYTGITRISDSNWSLALTADPGAPSGDATEVGDWVTMSAADVEVTSQRNWDETNFVFLEIELENTHASADHTVTYLGFRVEMAAPSYPEVFVDCEGIGVSHGGTSYGATRNPALIIKDLHTRLLELPEARIGSSFAAAITALANWKLDVVLTQPESSERVIERIIEQTPLLLWRDGDNLIQLAVIQGSGGTTGAFSQSATIIDAEGDGFRLEWVPPDEIFTRVRVNWSPLAARPDYQKTPAFSTMRMVSGRGRQSTVTMINVPRAPFVQKYYITDAESSPSDPTREAQAAAVQAATRTKNEMVIEAPDVQDSATALALLRWNFDLRAAERRRMTFLTPAAWVVEPGDRLAITHELLTGSNPFVADVIVKKGEDSEITATEVPLGLAI